MAPPSNAQRPPPGPETAAAFGPDDEERYQTFKARLLDELLRRGADRPSNIELGNEMKALCDMGFFTRENKWYTLVPGMVINVVER